MPEYRVQIFNRHGGVQSEINLTYDDDQEAIDAVIEYSKGHLTELWVGDRLVKRFDADGPTAPNRP